MPAAPNSPAKSKPHKDLEELNTWLYGPAADATAAFCDHKYGEASSQLKGALQLAIRQVDKLRDANPSDVDLSNLATRARAGFQLAKGSRWHTYSKREQAALMRTVLNDIRNEHWRRKDKPATLMDRLGGDCNVASAIREAAALAARDTRSGVPAVSEQALISIMTSCLLPQNQPGGPAICIQNGRIVVPPSSGEACPPQPNGVATVVLIDPKSLARFLDRALQNHCVPRPDINEWLKERLNYNVEADDL
jgi:hypothetical protein